MPIYTAFFRTDSAGASHSFEARSPQEALKKARALYDEGSEELIFSERYDNLNQVIVRDDDLRQVARWQDKELRLRLAAPDMLEALELCESCLADLARPDDGTPSALALTKARAAITKAKPETVAIVVMGTARPLPPDPALPPDPENMNGDRAEWAAAALRRLRRETGCDYEDSLGDLLGDLMHWCDRTNFDFETELGRARGYYEEETQAD